jgi:hypothetical protein
MEPSTPVIVEPTPGTIEAAPREDSKAPAPTKHPAARYIPHCYQADKDHNWTEGRDNSARDKGSAGGTSGGHRSSAIQGRIDFSKDILKGFEVIPANPLVGGERGRKSRRQGRNSC